MGTCLIANLKQVGEALANDQGDVSTAALKQRVGRDGGPEADITGRDDCLGTDT